MKRGHLPMRMCVICRRRLPQRELTRFVAGAEDPVMDAALRLPGRGWYVCAQAECLHKIERYRPRRSKTGKPRPASAEKARS